MIAVNLEKLRNNQEASWLVLDVIMLGLLMINLSWLIFDWLFTNAAFANLIEGLSSPFHDFYKTEIRPNFFQYDLIFVTLFISEFLLRWAASIRRESHARWYWYPFIHWYEVLGCIPLTGFRVLRLLRIVSMLYRLQHLGVINLAETRAGKFLRENYDVLIEHISDRVVLNVLSGIQDEIRHGQPVFRSIVNDVVKPQKTALSEAVAKPIATNLERHYNRHREEIRRYLDKRIAEAMQHSEDISRLEKIPMLGHHTIELLERAISDIVFNILNQSAADLTHIDNQQLIPSVIKSSLETLLQESPALDKLGEQILLDAIEVIKARVKENKALEQVKTSLKP